MEKVKKPLIPTTFLLLHAYDQNADGLPDIESRARAKKAAQVYQRLVQQQGKRVEVGLVVSYCGIRSGKRFVDTMADFLASQGVARQDIIKAPFGQNTAGEIDSCIRCLHNLQRLPGFQQNGSVARMVSVSSFYHLPRIWYLWFRRGWKAGVVGSFQAVHYSSVLKEVLKIGHFLMRPFAAKIIS